MKRPIIVALDGTSASGKTSLCIALAKKLKFLHLDTGVALRSLSLYLIRQGTNDEKAALKLIKKMKYEDIQKALKDKDLKSSEVSTLTSCIGGVKEISYGLIKLLHNLVKELKDEYDGFIISGRNIQTEAFPKAPIKIFLTASLETRGKRRYDELKLKGKKVNLKQVTEELAIRDNNDQTRKISPLKMAKDAFLLDNTKLTEKQTIEEALKYINSKIK